MIEENLWRKLSLSQARQLRYYYNKRLNKELLLNHNQLKRVQMFWPQVCAFITKVTAIFVLTAQLLPTELLTIKDVLSNLFQVNIMWAWKSFQILIPQVLELFNILVKTHHKIKECFKAIQTTKRRQISLKTRISISL